MIYKFTWLLRAIIYSNFFLKLGFPSYIGKPIFLKGIHRASIGRKVRIFPGIRIEVSKLGRLYIEDDVAVAQNVHITCGKKVVIKKGTCIAANVCITDTSHNYHDITVNILKQKDFYNNTIINENCFIGFGSVINSGVVLGRNCVVGANSFVATGVYPDFSVLVGQPAKVVKRYENGGWISVK